VSPVQQVIIAMVPAITPVAVVIIVQLVLQANKVVHPASTALAEVPGLMLVTPHQVNIPAVTQHHAVPCRPVPLLTLPRRKHHQLRHVPPPPPRT
jgi:predicted alpha/beta hydrolase family esterase